MPPPSTSVQLAPIFQPLSSRQNVAQGTWKVIPDELLIFTDSRVESRYKIAGFDLDGTLIRTVSGNVFPKNVDDWQLWSAEVAPEIRRLHATGYKICIFTNQKGIKVKKVSQSAFKLKIQKICAKIGVPIQVFVSLGTPNYRKPFPGMWERLERVENSDVRVERAESLYVGDAAGRLRTSKRTRADHSLADRLFALNVSVAFFTPEQFFAKQTEEEPYKLSQFNPAGLFERQHRFVPIDASFPFRDDVGAELVVLVGAPASGKSTLALRLAREHDYAIVSQDDLKTAVKCGQHVDEHLKNGQRVIVDNTNRNVETRKRYVDLARAHKAPCRCVYMECSADQAAHNNLFRKIAGLADERHELVNSVALRRFFSEFQQPVLDEGFVDVIQAYFMPEFTTEEHRRIFRMHLVEKPET